MNLLDMKSEDINHWEQPESFSRCHWMYIWVKPKDEKSFRRIKIYHETRNISTSLNKTNMILVNKLGESHLMDKFLDIVKNGKVNMPNEEDIEEIIEIDGVMLNSETQNNWRLPIE